MRAPQLAMATTSPEPRLAEALALIGEVYGVRPPAPGQQQDVVTFLAEALAALALDHKALSAARQGKR